MMYDEFQKQLEEYANGAEPRECTLEDYKKIEYVYTWHPAIAAVGGKRQIAIIWQEFGMGMIKDMYPVAKDMASREKHRATIRADLKNLDDEIKNIKDSYR